MNTQPAYFGGFIRVAQAIIRARGVVLANDWLSRLMLPLSITSRWPLVVSIPLDVYKYTMFHERHPFGDLLNNSTTLLRKLLEATEWANQFGIFYSIEVNAEEAKQLWKALDKFTEDHAVRSADGTIEATTPQVWYRDP